MRGLLIKDFYNLRNNIKSFMLSLALFLAMGFILDNPVYIFIISTVFVVNNIWAVFTQDEKNNWLEYALVLPISREELVRARYLFSGAILAIGSLISIVFIFIFSNTKENFLIGEMFISYLAVMSYLLFIVSIIIPVAYSKGVEKARYVLVSLGILPMLIPFIWPRGVGKININISPSGILIMVAIILSLFLVISIKISEKIVLNKDY